MKETLNISHPFEARVQVEYYLHGIRVDRFLSRHFRNYTVFRIQRMISAGLVSINDTRIRLESRVHQGEEVKIRLLEPPDKLIDPEKLPLDILYEDPWIIAIDKPAGQVAHPVGIYQTGTLCNALQYHLDQQTALKGLLRPGIVHRLDRMTSGVMVVAKDHLSHRNLSISFQTSQVEKTYIALVEGEIQEDEGIIDQPIGLLPGKGSILMSASPDAQSPKRALTRYRVLEKSNKRTLVKAFPETGRNHQIRVHFASIGHPVIGDDYYGEFGKILKDPYTLRPNKMAQRNPLEYHKQYRHALHSSQLKFKHPVTGDPFEIQTRYNNDELIRMYSDICITESNQQ